MSNDAPKPFVLSVIFWTENDRRLAALRYLTDAALKIDGQRQLVAQFVKALNSRASLFNFGLDPKYSVKIWDELTLTRFAAKSMPRQNPECMSAIAAELFRNAASAGGPASIAYQAMLDSGHPDIRTEFGAFCDATGIALGVWDWRAVTKDEQVMNIATELGVSGGMREFFASLVNATQMTDTQRTAELVAFPEERFAEVVQFRRFLIYRNSVAATRFSKMYGFFRRAGNGYEHPTFAIWYCDDNGRTIQTTSILLGAQQAIYLFGTMGAGVGLNLIALSRKALAENSFAGLQLSTDSNGIPIASRLLFVETEIETFQDAGIGIFSRTKLAKEPLTQNQRAALSNRVGIERTDLEHDGAAISHIDAQAMVAAQLAGSPIRMRETGGDFNPADADHLPFNTALHLG